MVFSEYAHYYDLLYRDKNYFAEANYIDQLIKKYKVGAGSILDLGCGTGRHAALLSKKGYTVHGVDLSHEMLEDAIKRAQGNERLAFSESNIQDFNLHKKFDVVTALFHVMSYQVTQEMVEKVFCNVRKHLNKDGVFIFDCWYGPAVLTEKPEIRVKRLEDDKIKVTRIAEPVLRENENLVDVNYDVFIQNKMDGEFKEVKETHIMRYFFKEEIQRIFQDNGFIFVECFEFFSGNSLSGKSWGSCFVGKAKE